MDGLKRGQAETNNLGFANTARSRGCCAIGFADECASRGRRRASRHGFDRLPSRRGRLRSTAQHTRSYMSGRNSQVGIAFFVFTAVAPFFTCLAGDTEDMEKSYKEYRQVAKGKGWLASYNRGHEILSELLRLSPEQQKKMDIAAYRGERIAVVGGSAPPGATNDLVTDGGFYLRVVNPKGKDLHPPSPGNVMIRGTIMQVFPQNKIIIIKVSNKDWDILMMS